MFGFEYYSPTKVIFGKGTENQAGELRGGCPLLKFLPKGRFFACQL